MHFNEDGREVFFRVEGRIHDGRVTLYLFKFPVVKRTPCGAIIGMSGIGRETKFVNLSWRKRYAVPTIPEAIESFKRRKECQLRKLKGQIEDTEDYLRVIYNASFDYGNDTYSEPNKGHELFFDWEKFREQ